MDGEPNRRVDLSKHLADMDMHREMFEASPDGRAWLAELQRRIDALPDATIAVDFSD